MRIVHYSTLLSRSAGGLYFSVSGLAKAQAALGAEVTIIGGADASFEADKAIWAPLEVHAFPLRLGRYGLAPTALATLWRLKPDILHLHGIWTAGSLHAAIAPARARIVSPRGMLESWILARKPRVKAVHAALFERPLLRRAHVHALNDNERQSVEAFMPALQKRIFVLPNGIDEDPPHGPAGQRSGALYIGRLHEKKQVLELIRAWSHLGPEQKLVVAGWGAPAYTQMVADAAGATRNVTFVGPLYGEAKAEALTCARLFILPSLSEGLPMAVLEAIQHGCVPLLTDGCNLPELLADGIGERIASDFSDLAPIARRNLALSDAAFAARSQAATAYSRRYLWQSIARCMLARYEAILTSGGEGAN
ncbi:MAG: hypothetical protein ABS76_22375 [Pelagibacterium sp. SCN 64-44]|nr:MAG: hypothetical protein ABS76_22375 [Pelagibacterium sp. SCN 64-44]